MRFEKITGKKLGLWNAEDAIWLEFLFFAVRLFDASRFDWSDRGSQWGVSFQGGGIWLHWKDSAYPPRRYGLPFLGRP